MGAERPMQALRSLHGGRIRGYQVNQAKACPAPCQPSSAVVHLLHIPCYAASPPLCCIQTCFGGHMSGLNPRISVTLTPAVDAALKRLSEASGQSRSSLVGEILGQSLPVFERLAIVIETAKTATEEAKARMASNMEAAQTKLESHLGIVQDLFDEQTADLIGDLEAIGRRKARGAGGRTDGRAAPARAPGGTPRKAASRASQERAQPPHVTRGSGTPVTTPKKKGKTATKPATTRVGRKNGSV